MQNANRTVGTAREQERAYANHRRRRGHRGTGPTGIFCAPFLLQRGFTGRIVIVDNGLAAEDRVCPKQAGASCANCEPCRITTGFSGAGAFSDGKLSLSADVGSDLPDHIGRGVA